jgi:gamma-F420-2:alpha-L-glutamate ligase
MRKVWIISRFTLMHYVQIYPTEKDMEEITNDGSDNNLYEDLQLYKSVTNLGLECQIIQISKLVNQIEIDKLPDIAIIRFNIWGRKDIEILRKLESYGVLLLNSSKSHLMCADKWTQWNILNEAGVNTPKTIFIYPHEYKRKLNDLELISFIENNITFPLIVKPSNGSRGDNIHLCHNMDDIKIACDNIAIPKNHSVLYDKILIQKWIDPKNMGVISAFTIDGNVVVAQQRRPIISDKLFVSNFRENSTRNAYTITDGLHDICKNACTALNNVDMVRMDILHDGKNYTICEVNSPGAFASIDMVNKIKCAHLIATHITNLLGIK